MTYRSVKNTVIIKKFNMSVLSFFYHLPIIFVCLFIFFPQKNLFLYRYFLLEIKFKKNRKNWMFQNFVLTPDHSVPSPKLPILEAQIVFLLYLFCYFHSFNFFISMWRANERKYIIIQ